MFCDLLATQLRQLHPRDKLLVKMQINNAVYNYLMKPAANMSSPCDQGGHSLTESPVPPNPVHAHEKLGYNNHPPSFQFHIPSAQNMEADAGHRPYFPPRYFYNS